MNLDDIARMRLRNTRLTGARHARPEDAVGWMLAVQSQDYPAAKWGLAQRLRNPADSAIERAFSEGRILRTHIMRPTWHFVLPRDLRWLLALTAPRVRQAMSYYDRNLEIDATLLKRAHKVIAKELRDGRHRTRAELTALLAKAGIEAKGQRLYHIIMHAELDALICSGAMRGKQQTYALVDQRAPDALSPLRRDDALAELTQRYFASHGPAQARDLAWWSGLTVKDAQRGIDASGAVLERADVEGRVYWYVRTSSRAPAIKDPTVWLLPNYDEYLIAYRDHAASFGYAPTSSSEWYDVLARHIIVLNGYVAGGWRTASVNNALTIDTKLFRRLTPSQQAALRSAAAAYSAFMGAKVVVRGEE
jgi:hypothetical protein